MRVLLQSCCPHPLFQINDPVGTVSPVTSISNTLSYLMCWNNTVMRIVVLIACRGLIRHSSVPVPDSPPSPWLMHSLYLHILFPIDSRPEHNLVLIVPIDSPSPKGPVVFEKVLSIAFPPVCLCPHLPLSPHTRTHTHTDTHTHFNSSLLSEASFKYANDSFLWKILPTQKERFSFDKKRRQMIRLIAQVAAASITALLVIHLWAWFQTDSAMNGFVCVR